MLNDRSRGPAIRLDFHHRRRSLSSLTRLPFVLSYPISGQRAEFPELCRRSAVWRVVAQNAPRSGIVFKPPRSNTDF